MPKNLVCLIYVALGSNGMKRGYSIMLDDPELCMFGAMTAPMIVPFSL